LAFAGALLQEGIDGAVILNALRALQGVTARSRSKRLVWRPAPESH
jgi:hypothetical protein